MHNVDVGPDGRIRATNLDDFMPYFSRDWGHSDNTYGTVDEPAIDYSFGSRREPPSSSGSVAPSPSGSVASSGGRSGPLHSVVATAQKAVKVVGACWRCKVLRKSVSSCYPSTTGRLSRCLPLAVQSRDTLSHVS